MIELTKKNLVAKGQEVASLAQETVLSASDVLVQGFQDLLAGQADAGKTLVAAGRASLAKAKTDGFMTVAAKPADYVPVAELTTAASEAGTTLAKAGTELAKVVKDGVTKIVTAIKTGPAANDAQVAMKAASDQVKSVAAEAAAAIKKTKKAA